MSTNNIEPQIDQAKEERLSREVIDLVIKEERELSAISRVLINAVFMVVNSSFNDNIVQKEHRIDFLNALGNGITNAIAEMKEREVSTKQ